MALPRNKKIISPGQALLILIDQKMVELETRKDAGTQKQLLMLKKLYLAGVNDEGDLEKIKHFFQASILKEFEISFDPKVINNDPTRRYFESDLAYHTFQNTLNLLDVDALQQHYNHIYSVFDSLKNNRHLEKETQLLLQNEATTVLEGEFKGLGLISNKLYQEYNDTLLYLRSLDNDAYSENFKRKAELLLKSVFLSVIIAQHSPTLTLAETLPLAETYDREFTDEKRARKTSVSYNQTKDSQEKNLTIQEYAQLKSSVEELALSIKQIKREMILLKRDKNSLEQELQKLQNPNENFNEGDEEGIYNSGGESEGEETPQISEEALIGQIKDLEKKWLKLDQELQDKNNSFLMVKENLEKLEEALTQTIKPLSQVKGIFKETMRNQIPSYAKHLYGPSFFFRPPDASEPELEGKWSKDLFAKLTIPFVNSFSGTFYAQLRVLKKLELEEKKFKRNKTQDPILHDKNLFQNYLKSLISLLLYTAGGHSLYEFIYPMFISKEIERNFQFIENFKELNEEFLFFANNEQAFDLALANAVRYNYLLLGDVIPKQEKLQEEILEVFGKSNQKISNLIDLLEEMILKEKPKENIQQLITRLKERNWMDISLIKTELTALNRRPDLSREAKSQLQNQIRELDATMPLKPVEDKSQSITKIKK